MIEIEKLKKYANKLMFDMNEDEYVVLQEEFETILKQLELMDKISGIKDVNPMTFPFPVESFLAEDTVIEDDVLTVDDVLVNSKHTLKDQIKVPKVVE